MPNIINFYPALVAPSLNSESDSLLLRGFNFVYSEFTLDTLSAIFNGALYIEEWRDINGYEGYYQVSSFGRIKSIERKVNGKNGHCVYKETAIMKPNSDNIYKRICLKKADNNTLQTYVHRIVCTHFNENLHNKKYVNHIDGVKDNNFFKNLEWCSSSENLIHSYKHLNRSRQNGEKNHNAIFKSDQIIEIRKYYKDGLSISEIAKIYGVKYKPIFRIVKNEVWGHLI